MRKREFIRELSRRLGDMPDKERENVIDYYDELIEDTIERTNKSEEEVIYELGSINDIVKRVKPSHEKIRYEEIIEVDDRDIIREERDSDDDYEEYKRFKQRQARKEAKDNRVEENEIITKNEKESKKRSSDSDGNLIIAKIIILILTFPVWFGLMSGLIGCIIVFSAGGIGVGVGGVASIIIGVTALGTSLSNAIFYIGVGIALIGLACIVFPLLVKFVVFLFKLLVRFVKWVFKTRKEND